MSSVWSRIIDDNQRHFSEKLKIVCFKNMIEESMPPRQCRHLPEADSQEVGNPTKDARGKHSCEHLQKYLFKKSSNGNISMLRGLQVRRD